MTENTPALAEIETIDLPVGLASEQVQALMGGLSPSRVSKRSGGGGSSLSYLEAWDVKATLIRVFGFGNFSAEVIDSEIFYQEQDKENAKKWTVGARATVRLTIHATGAVYTETAASSQSGSQGIGEVADFALKTAESDALKRAAIYLGTQFGLSLYDDGTTVDVVRVVMEPVQAEYVQELRDRQKARQAAAEAELQERLKTRTAAPESA